MGRKGEENVYEEMNVLRRSEGNEGGEGLDGVLDGGGGILERIGGNREELE